MNMCKIYTKKYGNDYLKEKVILGNDQAYNLMI